MNIFALVRLGGHLFRNTAECAEFFGVPFEYVRHMILSDNYPGCTVEFVVDDKRVSFLQTLSVMKCSDNC